jgi:hypothetical protein
VRRRQPAASRDVSTEVEHEEAMIRHTVETCPDDLDLLRDQLDQLSESGSRIIAVMWQGLNVVAEQSAAMQGRGSFVVVSQRETSGQRGMIAEDAGLP